MVERAGRSVVDRFLGMEEAAGSIPAQSIRFSGDFPEDFLYLYTRGTIQNDYAHPYPDPSRRQGLFYPL